MDPVTSFTPHEETFLGPYEGISSYALRYHHPAVKIGLGILQTMSVRVRSETIVSPLSQESKKIASAAATSPRAEQTPTEMDNLNDGELLLELSSHDRLSDQPERFILNDAHFITDLLEEQPKTPPPSPTIAGDTPQLVTPPTLSPSPSSHVVSTLSQRVWKAFSWQKSDSSP